MPNDAIRTPTAGQQVLATGEIGEFLWRAIDPGQCKLALAIFNWNQMASESGEIQTTLCDAKSSNRFSWCPERVDPARELRVGTGQKRRDSLVRREQTFAQGARHGESSQHGRRSID
jgi:hypothetical protein